MVFQEGEDGFIKGDDDFFELLVLFGLKDFKVGSKGSHGSQFEFLVFMAEGVLEESIKIV